MFLKHQHKFNYGQRGHGVPPKQNVPDPEIIDGHTEYCYCGIILFFPDDKNYRAVEVVI